MEIRQVETSSASGAEFLVVAVPTGTPLRVSVAPDSTIVGNLIWMLYVGVRESVGAAWKVGVFRRNVGRLRRDKLVMRQVLERGANPDRALVDLLDRTRSGEFDAPQ
ncbi:hypothetical protein BJ986_002390 [Phycicoccus badiiscoriae]|uniref:Uncharacterized protein n=1 Tax=Pedococcus badiiscoriae TaxID=642776 RepID=A0A852WF98_9MICO|nr:hypothetical protein [Pedococcus badiiscoriae]NYG07903.1 hypothetical protein [Pedococcus badiiscoriae]